MVAVKNISNSDIAYLRSVYGNGNPVGVTRDETTYRAKVLKRIALGSYPNERDACRAVVRWYKDRYGDAWRAVLASRHVNPVEYAERPEGGYRVRAWVYDSPVDVKVRCGAQVADYFPTLTIAKAAFRYWLECEFGMYSLVAPVFLYRLSDKFRPPCR